MCSVGNHEYNYFWWSPSFLVTLIFFWCLIPSTSSLHRSWGIWLSRFSSISLSESPLSWARPALTLSLSMNVAGPTFTGTGAGRDDPTDPTGSEAILLEMSTEGKRRFSDWRLLKLLLLTRLLSKLLVRSMMGFSDIVGMENSENDDGNSLLNDEDGCWGCEAEKDDEEPLLKTPWVKGLSGGSGGGGCLGGRGLDDWGGGGGMKLLWGWPEKVTGLEGRGGGLGWLLLNGVPRIDKMLLRRELSEPRISNACLPSCWGGLWHDDDSITINTNTDISCILLILAPRTWHFLVTSLWKRKLCVTMKSSGGHVFTVWCLKYDWRRADTSVVPSLTLVCGVEKYLPSQWSSQNQQPT